MQVTWTIDGVTHSGTVQGYIHHPVCQSFTVYAVIREVNSIVTVNIAQLTVV